MWTLARASLRSRWLSFVGILVTVVAATALVTATGSLLEGGIRGVVSPVRLTGTDIVVAASQDITETRGRGEDQETVTAAVVERVRVPTGLVADVSSTRGVERVVADVSFPAYVIGDRRAAGPEGTASVGHSWSSRTLAALRLVGGAAPDDPGEIVIDADLSDRLGLEVGDRTAAVVAGRTVEVDVAGIGRSTIDGLRTGQSSIYFSDADARDFYGHPGEADLLAITLRPGADPGAVAAALDEALDGQFVVLTGDERGRAEFLASAESGIRLIAISGSLGGIALFVAALVLAGMVSLFVQQRLREIALLRAVGATPRQVRQLLAREVLAVTLLGAIVGVWPGFWLGDRLADAMRGQGLLPMTFRVATGVWPPVVAIAAVLVVSRIAAYVAGRPAGRVRPIEALMGAATPRRGIGWLRATAGLVCAAGTGALLFVTGSVRASIAPALVPAILMASVVTAALFAPVLVWWGSHVAGLVLGRLVGASGYLGFANVRSQVRRVASAAIPLALTIGVAGMTLLQQATSADEAASQVRQRVIASHVVAAAPGGLAPAVVSELAAESPSDVVGLADTVVYANYELDPYGAKVLAGDSPTAVLDLGVVDGSLATLAVGEAAMSSDAAASLEAKVGEPVELYLGDGTRQDFTLVATYDRSLGFADVLLPWESAGAHMTDPALSLVLVGGGDERASAAAVAQLHRTQPAATVGGPEIVSTAEDANADTQAWVNYLLLGLVTAFAAFAVVNTLMLAIRDRSREFALLQLIGASRAQVRRMMRIEATFVTTLGWGVGTSVAALTMMPFSYVVTGSFVPSLPPVPVGAVLVSSAALVWVATMVPARGAMRTRPVEAIGIRE